MRVLTWNLWARFGEWQARCRAIREVLRAAGADVITLQETWIGEGRSQPGELAEELSMHWAWSPSPAKERWSRRLDGADVEVGNAILSRWPIRASESLALEESTGGDGRTVLHARLAAPFGDVPVFTTQLTSAPDQSALRCRQVRQIAEFVAANELPDFPPIVTGDLNAEPDADEVRLLCGHKTAPAVPGLVLVDAWRYADPDTPAWTWDRRNPYVRATREPSSRIDYVLVGIPRSAFAGAVVDARRWGDAPVQGVWPSDHFAVVADLLSPGAG